MGWLKSMFGTAVLAGALYGSYRIGKHEAERLPYAIKEREGQYSVLEKQSGCEQPIVDNFQLGGIDYRVDGLFKDMKKDAGTVEQSVMKNFHKHYQPR